MEYAIFVLAFMNTCDKIIDLMVFSCELLVLCGELTYKKLNFKVLLNLDLADNISLELVQALLELAEAIFKSCSHTREQLFNLVGDCETAGLLQLWNDGLDSVCDIPIVLSIESHESIG